jgi:hypothetical protein
VGFDILTDCAEQDQVCSGGVCLDTTAQCAEAMEGMSYLGCEYWATSLGNSLITPEKFQFAVAVANSSDEQAQIQVTDGAGFYQQHTVEPHGMQVIDSLPWKAQIRETVDTQTGVWATRQMDNAAYRIVSDRPVTVYQFNPGEYCSGSCIDFLDFSYSNDASLLLPTHVYQDEYMVVSRPTRQAINDGGIGVGYHPGLFAVIGTGDEPATLEITLSADTAASDATSDVAHPQRNAGDQFQVEIEPHQVLQILSAVDYATCPNPSPCGNNNCCEMGAQFDLTGTRIRVLSGPLPAVFGGHVCAYLPYDRLACDHLEQQLSPLVTWGSEYLCAHNITQHPEEPTIWRVVSGADGNQISFTPDVVHPALTLDQGEQLEFESQADFLVQGTGRLSVAQFMVGQQYVTDGFPTEYGDPSMALAVPRDQYRSSYIFLAPHTYAESYLTVIHPTGEYPLLDGTPISGDTVDIAAEHSRTNLILEGGIHQIGSSSPFAITVYGVGSFTSYMYPGGLDLRPLDVQ